MSNSPEMDPTASKSKPRLRFSLLALFIFVTLVCCLLTWSVQKKKVAATAIFRVNSTPPMLGPEVGSLNEHEFRVLKETQLALLKSYFVLNAAVRKPGIAALPILAGKKPEEWLEQHLEADFPGGSEVLEIKLRGTEDQTTDLVRLVDAVAKAYADEVVYKERAEQAGEKDLLQRSLDELRQKIADKSELVNAIVKDSGKHDEATMAALQQLALDRLERIEVELMRLENEQLQLEGDGETDKAKFYDTRIAQLRERQTEIVKQLAQASEPSPELDALKAEIEHLQQVASELAIKLQKLAINADGPSRIEQIQRAVVSAAD